MPADLTRTATLAGMIRLRDEAFTEVERAGREPTTPAGDFAGRGGYAPGFLGGWDIPLPAVTGRRMADVRPLRRAAPGPS